MEAGFSLFDRSWAYFVVEMHAHPASHSRMDNRDMYTGLEADTYDELLQDEIEDQPFWEAFLAENEGPCLEVGCGTGRVLLPLLEAGYEVDGLDVSGQMLDICRAKAQEIGKTPALHEGSMVDFELNSQYQTIIIPGFSYQLVGGREQCEQALDACFKHLKAGGFLAISLFFPWEEIEDREDGQWRFRKQTVRDNGERLVCHQATQMDLFEQELTLLSRYEVYGGNRQLDRIEFRDTKINWFFPREFVLLLEKHGFEFDGAYADFTFELLADTAPHAVFIARRPLEGEADEA